MNNLLSIIIIMATITIPYLVAGKVHELCYVWSYISAMDRVVDVILILIYMTLLGINTGLTYKSIHHTVKTINDKRIC